MVFSAGADVSAGVRGTVASCLRQPVRVRAAGSHIRRQWRGSRRWRRRPHDLSGGVGGLVLARRHRKTQLTGPEAACAPDASASFDFPTRVVRGCAALSACQSFLCVNQSESRISQPVSLGFVNRTWPSVLRKTSRCEQCATRLYAWVMIRGFLLRSCGFLYVG